MLSKRKKLALRMGLRMGPPKISPALYNDGTVGLRIVAAMSADCIGSVQKSIKDRPKSEPIPIRPRGPATAVGPAAVKMRMEELAEDQDGDVELSESYTCVISRVGGRAVRKRVYHDGGAVVVDGISGKFGTNSGVFLKSPAAAADLFMSRGDKALLQRRMQMPTNRERQAQREMSVLSKETSQFASVTLSCSLTL